MAKKIPPFYENFDNTHCTQCTLRGILEYFEPDEVWSWEEWDKFTDKEPDKWTWPQRTAINMMNRGYELRAISNMDLERYLEIGVYEALVERLGVEAANKQREMADFVKVRENIVEYVQHPRRQQELRIPTIQDLRDLLAEGYLINVSLNGRALIGKEGYSGHSVLVYRVDATHVYCHSAGGISEPEKAVLIADFLAAASKPTPSVFSIMAYKLEKKHA